MSKDLRKLAQEWHACKRCELAESRACPNIVFGAGSPSARLLMVYEAPTEKDAVHALPFTGKEGHLLAGLLERAGIDHTDVFCTPLVGCQPTRHQAATAEQDERTIDREPSKEEIAACAPRIKEIIYRVDPRLIFTFGLLAFRSLVEPKDRGGATSLDGVLGELHVTRIPGRLMTSITYDVIPLLGVKKILASPSMASHGAAGSTEKYLREGNKYARYIEETGQRDSRIAGFGKED